MKTIGRIVLVLLAWCGVAPAQEFPWKMDFGHFASQATETVDVTLDKNLLNLAKNFLSDKDADEREARDIISNLNGVFVRSYEFDKPGVYSEADIEAMRGQLKSPEWSRVVGVKSKRDGETDYVYVRQAGGKITGLAVIAAESREFTLVYIDGPIDLEKVRVLGGQLGVPRLDTGHAKLDDSHKSKGGE